MNKRCFRLLGDQDKACGKASKEMVQAKLASVYGKSTLRTDNAAQELFQFEDCVVVERPQSHATRPKGPAVSSFLQVEEEERSNFKQGGSLSGCLWQRVCC